MAKYTFLLWATLAVVLNACGSKNHQNNDTTTGGILSSSDFKAKMEAHLNVTLVDVRTPEEYENGHLANAFNIDWNSNAFENKIVGFERDKPILVYCLSGARSASAAQKMRSLGFKQVFELDGGMMKWRAAGLPETTATMPKPTGMSREQFDTLLNSDKLVLIDFYADWCAPCKKMAPYLDEIKTEMGDKVEVVRINTDDNQDLASQLSIDGLPTVVVFKKKTLVWKNVGYIEKEELVKHLN
jgi:thioredoxin 1